MNRDSAIGVFDSGIGGLTVLHKIMEVLPRENTLISATPLGHLTAPNRPRRCGATPWRTRIFCLKKA
jgi:hypothetical protein